LAVVLTVYEIYQSIQGESTHAGRPCVFVRLAACDLRCVWCDTTYAFTGGRRMTVDDVLRDVEAFACPLVEVTGGEPLLQRDAVPLMEALLARGRTVLLETGGHRSINEVPDPVIVILDVKCPGSGEAARMHWPNLDQLSPHDEVKFVIADRADFDYAACVVRTHRLHERVAAVLFSPAHGVIAPSDLAAWILEARVPARLQLQAHKYIWSPEARGV
jgi:7-carboxy-7-deazaguanine synthase